MALHPVISMAAAIVAMDAITALINVGGAGTLEVYSGAQPQNPTTAIGGGNTLLATLALSDDAFGNAVAVEAGVAGAKATATAASITDDVSANATGTAAWFRIKDGNGLGVIDGTVGVSGTNLTVNTVAFVEGADIAATGLSLSVPTGE